MDRDGDLAVGLLAQLAAVLVLHAHGMPALLGEAGVIDDEDPPRAGEGLGHHGAIPVEDRLLVPGALVDELLQGLFGILDRQELGWERDPSDHWLDAFALAILQQPAEIDAAPGALCFVAKVVPEEIGVAPEPTQDFGGQFRCMSLVHTAHTNKSTGRFVRFNGVVLSSCFAGLRAYRERAGG